MAFLNAAFGIEFFQCFEFDYYKFRILYFLFWEHVAIEEIL